MEKEKLGLRGIVSYVLRDKNGKVKEQREINNQIQNAGLTCMASLIASDNPDSKTAFDYMAIGTGTGQAVTATTLATESSASGSGRRGGSDVVGTLQTTTTTDDTIQFQTTWSFTGSLAITEAGIFNDASAGDMLAYQDFSAINVANGDSLQVTWKIVFARA
jgi:hypothetical protein